MDVYIYIYIYYLFSLVCCRLTVFNLDVFVKINLSVFGVLALFSCFFYNLGWIGHASCGSLQGQCE